MTQETSDNNLESGLPQLKLLLPTKFQFDSFYCNVFSSSQIIPVYKQCFLFKFASKLRENV